MVFRERKGGVNTNIQNNSTLADRGGKGTHHPFHVPRIVSAQRRCFEKGVGVSTEPSIFGELNFTAERESTYLPGKQFIRIQRGDVE
ncbi:hypothetical protein CDAR_557271 [Caerostris darwini]|uniref:Uncharacterized protein n=1 Tax=Caerostris darwini TaxID=1538125 RepID=A0AAV4P506_9ARAC|nr:hypothetical protein CDAR_557271 [Caerostris darwini]